MQCNNCNLICPYHILGIGTRNSTSLTRPFLTRRCMYIHGLCTILVCKLVTYIRQSERKTKLQQWFRRISYQTSEVRCSDLRCSVVLFSDHLTTKNLQIVTTEHCLSEMVWASCLSCCLAAHNQCPSATRVATCGWNNQFVFAVYIMCIYGLLQQPE